LKESRVFVPVYVFVGMLLSVSLCFGYLAYRCRKSDLTDQENAMLHDLFDAPGHGLVLFDSNGNFVKANKQAYIFLEFLNEEGARNKKLPAFLDYMFDHAVDCDESLRSAVVKASEKAPDISFKEVIGWGDGNLCLVEAMKRESGGTVLVLVDISSMREQEERFLNLYDTNFGLKQAVEAAPAGIVITSPARTANPIVFCNTMFAGLLGAEPEGLINVPVDAVFQAMADEGYMPDLYGAFNLKEPSDIELCRTDNKGEKRYFRFFLKPVLEANDKPDVFIGILSDITALKKREASLFQSQKLEALGQLAAGVAHDFNNVLSIIDGYARLINQGSEEKGQKQEVDYSERIRQASSRGAALTKKMLTFSHHKVEQSNVEDMAKIILEQEELMAPLMNENTHLLISTRSHENLHIECNTDDITQILMNLVINARDAMPGGGEILVQAYRVPADEISAKVLKNKALDAQIKNSDFACLSVIDQGHGMTEEIIGKIFDPFYTTKEAGKGTGLGLSMVYGLVKNMGGYIDVRSEPEQGTAFYIYIPITSKALSRQPQGTPDRLETLSLKGYRVIVAEDEPDLLKLVSDMLETLDMTVFKASNGDEALLRQEEAGGNIDLLLTDISMPGIDGIKLAELMRSLEPDIKILFMSGYPAHKENDAWPQEGKFMAKPVRMEVLARIVFETLLGRGKDENSADKATAVWTKKPDERSGV